MWNDRYCGDNFAYGIEPNSFLVEHAGLLTGPVLSLAEREGRNAVYLPSLGLDVLGVDASDVGLAKAHRLAETKHVSIRSVVVDLATYVPPANSCGSVVSISAHLPTVVRRRLYPLIEQCLKPGRFILLEAYAKSQFSRNTGGAKDSERMLQSKIFARSSSTANCCCVRKSARSCGGQVSHRSGFCRAGHR